MNKKTVVSFFFAMITMIVNMPVMAESPSNLSESSPTMGGVVAMSPRYSEISDTSFAISKTRVKAELNSWEKTNLSIDLYIYLDGKQVAHFPKSTYGTSCIINTPKSFASNIYDVTCTFTAGNETVTYSKEFNI